jgi:very-short-patch-repair endonuclease
MPAMEALMQSFTSKKVARRVELEQYAWRNRAKLTESEAKLWQALRGRRQVVLLDRYIVDFYAPAARLVVEVDGGYHTLRRRADARRDRNLLRRLSSGSATGGADHAAACCDVRPIPADAVTGARSDDRCPW